MRQSRRQEEGGSWSRTKAVGWTAGLTFVVASSALAFSLTRAAAGRAAFTPAQAFTPLQAMAPPIAAPSSPAAPGSGSGTQLTVSPARAGGPTLAQMVGQKLVVAMKGFTPSADLLGRISRGEIGGVILVGSNIATRAQLTALTQALRGAAAAGGRPPLLIGIDQEGGPVKRISWVPPTISPAQLGATGTASMALSQGAETAAALHALGIDVDFAPVADVPATTASFMYRDHRVFSFDAKRTALLADAFATGLESRGVLPSMKHFPGIGYATRNTDSSVVTIGASRAALAPGLLPYRTAIAHHIPLVMLSNATYKALDPLNAAGWSYAIGFTLLRHELGFTGVTITDSLDGTAHARGVTTSGLAVRAAMAGTDMILTTGSEASSRQIYDALLRAAGQGSIPTTRLRASYSRIVRLKAGL